MTRPCRAAAGPAGAGAGRGGGGHGADRVLGECFVRSFLTYKRNEVERFERYVTDWEFREYAYHLKEVPAAVRTCSGAAVRAGSVGGRPGAGA